MIFYVDFWRARCVSPASMSIPRQVLPGQFCLITRRCSQRMFLLRPDDETNNAVLYCLAEAALYCNVVVLMSVVISNHHHTVIYDPLGRCSEFVERFHKHVARSQNVLRGHSENLWSAEEPCITRLLDLETVIAKMVYTAGNPVKDRLVARASQWPGLTTYTALLSGSTLQARRPRHFFRKNGPMPEFVTLTPTIPPELGPAEPIIRAVREGVEAVEQQVERERLRTGAGVVGRRNILRQDWRESPTSAPARRGRRPRFAGRIETRVPALLLYRSFLAAYRAARAQWISGLATIFPRGTYWLARFAGVPISADA